MIDKTDKMFSTFYGVTVWDEEEILGTIVSRQTFNQLQFSLRFLSAGTSATTVPSTRTIILPSLSYHPVSVDEPRGYKRQMFYYKILPTTKRRSF